MKINSPRPVRAVVKAVLAGILSAVACFGQNKPAPARPSAPRHAASTKGPSVPKVVLKVGNGSATDADINYLVSNLAPQVRQQVAVRGRAAVGEQYAMMLLLAQKARDEHLDASPDFRRGLALHKNRMLAQAEYNSLESRITVSPDEVSAYYAAHPSEFERARIREFAVREKQADAKPGDPGLSLDEAKSRLDSIRKAVAAGTSMAQVGKQFDIPNVVMIEEEPRTVRRGELVPAMDRAVFELKDNQFSDPIDVSKAVVLLQVLDHHQETLKDVSADIETTIRQQKTQAALEDLKAKTNVWMDPVYFKTPAAPKPSANEPEPAAHP